jgi:hypothetical protein
VETLAELLLKVDEGNFEVAAVKLKSLLLAGRNDHALQVRWLSLLPLLVKVT